jgi:hypothetical protein
MFTIIAAAVAHCHQVPSATHLMHQLGLFYQWHIWNVLPPKARIICR